MRSLAHRLPRTSPPPLLLPTLAAASHARAPVSAALARLESQQSSGWADLLTDGCSRLRRGTVCECAVRLEDHSEAFSPLDLRDDPVEVRELTEEDGTPRRSRAFALATSLSKAVLGANLPPDVRAWML